MIRLSRFLWAILSSQALPPLVIGFFLVVYIGIAFFTDETLISLMAFTRSNLFLAAVLALLPLNSICRIVEEAISYRKRRRAMSDTATPLQPTLYDETVALSARAEFAELERRLGAAGYSTRRSGNLLAAWRGLGLSLARILYFAGTFCLFAGILISLVSRTVSRQTVIEGVPFPTPSGNGGLVEKISYWKSSGPFLARNLLIEVAGSGGRSGVESFGVYPPSRFRGKFVYPRYLGIALKCRLTAPDLPGGAEKFDVLPLYPPGRESSTTIEGTPYRLNLILEKPGDGTDPYMTGKMVFLFKLLRGKDVVSTGSLSSGGEFTRDDYRLEISDARRMVMTDFVRDDGVLLIWVAGLFLALAAATWFPLRIFLPRREMLFQSEGDSIQACSLAEGRRRSHAGVFHEALDLLETTRHERRSSAGEEPVN